MGPITETKKIPRERWSNFCEAFSNENRGRVVNITIIDEDIGELLAEGTIFSAIDYDPVRKGDVIVISYGGTTSVAFHDVAIPLEIWEAQDESGIVVALEISAAEDRQTIIKFE